MGLHARQHAGQPVDGLVLDLDAEDLPDGDREITAGSVDLDSSAPTIVYGGKEPVLTATICFESLIF